MTRSHVFATAIVVMMTQTFTLRCGATALVTDTDAYLLMDRQLVSESHVSQASWSPDGRYILTIRKKQTMPVWVVAASFTNQLAPKDIPPTEESIVIWNSSDQRSSSVWHKFQQNGSVKSLEWLSRGNIALALVEIIDKPAPEPTSEPIKHYELLRIDASSGTVRTLCSVIKDEGLCFDKSPVTGSTIIRLMNRLPDETNIATSEQTILLRENGASIPLTLPTVPDKTSVMWSATGECIFVSSDIDKVSHKVINRYFAMNEQSLHFTELKSKPTGYMANAVATKYRVRMSKAPLTEGTSSTPITPFWLETGSEKDAPRALICANGSNAVLSPTCDALFYVDQETLWAVQIAKVDRDAYLRAKHDAEMTVAISNAKQLGLAIIMWAQDYDESMPSGDDIQNQLTPYVGTSSLFDGFTYICPATDMAHIESPATTEMGYVTAPGGRAIIYADGHVKWRENPAK